MCGVASILSFHNTRDLKILIKKMGDIIKHRGPDDEGHVIIDCSNQDTSADIHSEKEIAATIIHKNQSYSHILSSDPMQTKYNYISFCHRRLSIIDLSPAGHQPMSYTGLSTMEKSIIISN